MCACGLQGSSIAKDHKDESEGCSKCLYQTKIKLRGLNKLASGGRGTLLYTIMPIMAWDCARTAFHQSNEFCILLGNSEGKGSGALPVNQISAESGSRIKMTTHGAHKLLYQE